MDLRQEKVDKKVKQLKRLNPFKNKTEAEILEKAESMVDKSEKQETSDLISLFSDRVEKKIAGNLLDRYSHDYNIESVSDKNTLNEIIYLEVIQKRLQEKLNEIYQTQSKAVPSGIVDIIHKNSEAILRLKNSLGLNRTKQTNNPYDVLQHIQKRAAKWREENQGSRTIKCPECQKLVFLKIKTEAWETQKHPFFKDTVLYNEALFEKYYGKQVIVSPEFIGEVLKTSADYVLWIHDKRRIHISGDSPVTENTSIQIQLTETEPKGDLDGQEEAGIKEEEVTSSENEISQVTDSHENKT